jgi:hypothetical protein
LRAAHRPRIGIQNVRIHDPLPITTARHEHAVRRSQGLRRREQSWRYAALACHSRTVES